MKAHQKKEGNIIRRFYEPPTNSNDEEQHRTLHVVVRKAMPAGVNTRESNGRIVFGSIKDADSNNNIHAIGFEPVEEGKRFVAPATRKPTRNSTRRSTRKSTSTILVTRSGN